jgi:hypothetical protein
MPDIQSILINIEKQVTNRHFFVVKKSVLTYIINKETPINSDFTSAGARCNPRLITVPNILLQY